MKRSLILTTLVLACMVPNSWAAEEPEFLPRGVTIPEEHEIPAPPSPFKNGEFLLPNTQPKANLTKIPGAPLPVREFLPAIPGGKPDYSPNELPGSGDQGFWISGSSGVYAGNDAQTNLSIPANAIGTTIYAPTNMPAGLACIETVAAHYRYTGMSSTAHGHGFWDHCITRGWKLFELMNDTWRSKYVRSFRGEGVYFTEAYKYGNCSRGLLYNFTTGQWEEKATVCSASSGYPSGWSMWESHYLMDKAQVCPVFPDIRSSSIRVLKGDGTWTNMTSSYTSKLGPYGMCWTNGTYTFHVYSVNYDWEGRTP